MRTTNVSYGWHDYGLLSHSDSGMGLGGVPLWLVGKATRFFKGAIVVFASRSRAPRFVCIAVLLPLLIQGCVMRGTNYLATPKAGNTYYVATTGSDANSGTEAQPFLTIQQALNLAQPGQTVAVMSGSYQPATFVRSGSTNAAITLLAPSGATLVGDGTGVALTVSGLHDIVIDGFDISNFEIGIALGTVNNLVLRNNTLKSNTGVGIQGWKVTDSLFEYNEFLDPGPPYPDLMNAIQDYGLNFYYSARVTITNNYFFGKHNQALSLKRQNGTAYIADNTFAGCMYTCIYLGQNDDDSGGDMTSLDSLVEHNTIQDATDPVTGAYYRVSRGIGIRNVYGATVRNNTVSHAITAVETISSPQLWGQAAGNNQEYGNTVN